MRILIGLLILMGSQCQVVSQGFLYQKPHPKILNNYSPYIKNVQILLDTFNTKNFQYISSSKADKLYLSKDSVGITNPAVHTYWIKFQLQKIPDTTLVITLNPSYSIVKYYRPNSAGKYFIEQSGFKIPYSLQKNNLVPDILFQLSIVDTTTWHYLKIESPNAFVGLAFSVFPNAYLIDFLPSNFFKSGLFFGLIFFAFILNLILFLQLRQLSYLFYSLYTAMFAIYIAAELQFFSIFRLAVERFSFWIYSVPFVFMTVFLLLYIYSFFPSTERFKKIKIVSITMASIRLLLFLLAFFIKENSFLFSLLVETLSLLLPFTLILYYSKYYKPARYLGLAIGIIFIGYAGHFELLLYNQFFRTTFTIQNLGILEILLLSLALGSRIKTIEAEKQYNSDLLVIELKEKQLLKDRLNIELEEKVIERTLEINKMNKFLNEHNLHLELEVENLATARVMQETVSIEEFKKIFPQEEVCYKYLVDLKWENGFTCKFCNSQRHVLIDKPIINSRRCSDCRKVESPTANTIFHKLKFPIQKAFYILFLVSSGHKNTYEELSLQVDLRAATCFSFKKKIIEVIISKKVKKKGKITWSDYILP